MGQSVEPFSNKFELYQFGGRESENAPTAGRRSLATESLLDRGTFVEPSFQLARSPWEIFGFLETAVTVGKNSLLTAAPKEKAMGSLEPAPLV